MTVEKLRTETPVPDDHADEQAGEQPEKKSSALNIPGLLAGAATAATMSVIGGHLSVVGTVLGAALTSIVSGLAIVLYSTSLEKSRRGLQKVHTTMAQRVFARPGPDASAEGSSAVAGSSPSSTLRPRLKPILVTSGAVLGLAVAAVFGIQALTGTELSGGTGTIQRTVTGSEAVSERSASVPAPAEDPAAGTGEIAPADGTDTDDGTAVTPAEGTSGEGAPGEDTSDGEAVTGDGTTSGEQLPDTGSQQLDGDQTGADTGQEGAGAAVEPGLSGADAGAVPAAP